MTSKQVGLPGHKHVIYGGDGFVGRYIARDLVARGETVIIADLQKSDMPIYDHVQFVQCDVRNAEQVSSIPLKPGDMVYNMAARLLMPDEHIEELLKDFRGDPSLADLARAARRFKVSPHALRVRLDKARKS